jgi:hypothetical protein
VSATGPYPEWNQTRQNINIIFLKHTRVLIRGTRWRTWLKHCATSRKVAGSIPDDVIGIIHWHKISGRTIVLGSTQPLTEMSTRNIFRRKGGRCVDLTKLITFVCRVSWNLRILTSWNPQELSRPAQGLLYFTRITNLYSHPRPCHHVSLQNPVRVHLSPTP